MEPISRSDGGRDRQPTPVAVTDLGVVRPSPISTASRRSGNRRTATLKSAKAAPIRIRVVGAAPARSLEFALAAFGLTLDDNQRSVILNRYDSHIGERPDITVTTLADLADELGS